MAMMAEANMKKLAELVAIRAIDEYKLEGKSIREWMEKVEKLEELKCWLHDQRIMNQKNEELNDDPVQVAYYDGMTRAFEDVIKKLEEVMA